VVFPFFVLSPHLLPFKISDTKMLISNWKKFLELHHDISPQAAVAAAPKPSRLFFPVTPFVPNVPYKPSVFAEYIPAAAAPPSGHESEGAEAEYLPAASPAAAIGCPYRSGMELAEYVPGDVLRPRPPDMYCEHFDDRGAAVVTPTHRHAQSLFLLPNSRGVFLKFTDHEMTMERLLSFIRGGRVERVDFTPERGCAGVYFVLAEHAREYIRFARRWRGKIGASFVSIEAIPCAKGGHEPIKENIAKAIRHECATRVLFVDYLPFGTRADRMAADVKAQSGKLRVNFESLVIDEGTRRCTLRMGSIGTCLGARMRLGRLPWYRNCEYSFGPDSCEGSLLEIQ